MKVIMNADDFGFSKGVNLGILEAFQRGVVSSTSLMVNMPGFDHAVELMKQYPELNVGIHLVTSVQYSILKGLKTVTDENGHFYHDHDKIKNCDLEELKQEYEAQLQKFLATGFTPTHIDFHWCYYPVQLEAAVYLGKKYNLPVRAETKEIEAWLDEQGVIHNFNMQHNFYQMDASQTPEMLISQLQHCLDEGYESYSFELHPAYVDQPVLELSSYNIQRAKEFMVLTHPDVVKFFADNNIEKICFKDL